MTSSLFVNVRSAMDGTQHRPAGIIIAVEGTAYPGFPGTPSMILNNGTGFWSGFASGLVGGVINSQDGLFDSYLVAYGAATIPMWPTVQEAREDIVNYLGTQDGSGTGVNYAYNYFRAWGVYPPTILAGYSQGTMATDQAWVYDILTPPGGKDPNGKPTGRLHYLLPYVYRSYQFGHIFRTPGIAHGNALIGLSESIKQDGVETGGIGGPLDLTEAQTNYLAPDGKPVVYSCANKGDIYTCCSVGTDPWHKLAAEGDISDIFYKIIMQPTFADVVSVAKVLGHPIAGIIELFHVMKFFAAGPTAPHYLYFDQMVGCINDCYQLGLSLPHSL